MIDVQQVRELIELMVEHDLTEIRIKQGDTTVSLRKGFHGEVSVMPAPVVQASAMPPAASAAAAILPAPVPLTDIARSRLLSQPSTSV